MTRIFDIAVEGLSKKDYFSALARLMMESPFEIDLKPIEDVSDLFKQRIAKGKVLYEKERILDLISEIKDELNNISTLVKDIREVSDEIPKSRRKRRVYEESLALKLHNFYTGYERIFQKNSR